MAKPKPDSQATFRRAMKLTTKEEAASLERLKIRSKREEAAKSHDANKIQVYEEGTKSVARTANGAPKMKIVKMMGDRNTQGSFTELPKETVPEKKASKAGSSKTGGSSSTAAAPAEKVSTKIPHSIAAPDITFKSLVQQPETTKDTIKATTKTPHSVASGTTDFTDLLKGRKASFTLQQKASQKKEVPAVTQKATAKLEKNPYTPFGLTDDIIKRFAESISPAVEGQNKQLKETLKKKK